MKRYPKVFFGEYKRVSIYSEYALIRLQTSFQRYLDSSNRLCSPWLSYDRSVHTYGLSLDTQKVADNATDQTDTSTLSR